MSQAPYGSWKSPISTDLIVAGTIGIGGPHRVGDDQYWVEGRPQEGGRMVIVHRAPDGTETDMNPAPYNARTLVHEYGGGASFIHNGEAFFSNFSDQQVYVSNRNSTRQLTHSPELRFADGAADDAHNRIVYVVEDHAGDGEPQNLLAAVSLDDGTVTRLSEGHDFYASPTLNDAGDKLAWITWDHPDMPWDGTELWLADVLPNGELTNVTRIAGSRDESVQQPRFAPDGTLYFISDSSGWWNLYRRHHDGDIEAVCPMDAEFGIAHWTFGGGNYVFINNDEILCVYGINNEDTLARLDIASGELTPLDIPFTNIGGLSLAGNTVTFAASSPTLFTTIVNVNIETLATLVVKSSCTIELDTGYYSVPEAIEYPTADGDTAHAFYYAPANKDFKAPAGEFPPVIVMVHGGPTSATSSGLSLQKQFWTSRGFAILDVNYRGSTGYGRAYRQKLNHRWGIVDVEDTVHGVQYLAQRGLADPERLAIRGGSAGGFTTLAALTFTDTFKAGASLFGVGDLEALAKDTHKFESRYLDSMIGRYPEDIEVYNARSPIHHVDQLSCPVIFFQGLEDRVVPPNQAEAMVEALTKKGIPNAYVPFEGEQHGFRQAKNIKRSLDLELYFYSRIFGFSIADQIEPIAITNL